MSRKEQEKVAFWNVTYGCPRNCWYCFQGQDKPHHPSAEVVEAICRELKNLPGSWLLMLSGGELFAMPSFRQRIIPFLREETDHRFSVITNLSASIDVYRQFIAENAGFLTRMSGSLHLQYEGKRLNHFFEKVLAIKGACEEVGVFFTLNCVLDPSNLSLIADIQKTWIEKCGIKTVFQKLKILKDSELVPYEYQGEEVRLVDEILGRSGFFANTARSFEGRPCRAGIDYFVIEPNGAVAYCHEDERRTLGSMAKGTFELRKKSLTCQHQLCSCGIPAAIGIVSNYSYNND